MSNMLTIRSVIPTDFAQWKPLWEAYNRFYGRNSLPIEITQMTWTRFLDTDEPVHAIVAEKEGQLIGLAHYLFHRSTIQIELTCYLQDLFTDEATRGQGIGRTLIEAVYERARMAGSTRVYWQTQESNLIARKLYDKIAKLSNFIVYAQNISTV